MLRVLECFAGIGAASKALENLGIEHEIVDAVEIDKYAIKAFNAIHGTNFEPQDITKWDKNIEVDLLIHGSPCQDYSIAGLQAGGDKGSGTRSSLMYESVRIIEKLRPKYIVWENVKNLLSKKHRHNFDAYLETMEKFGYRNYYQILDAQNYGVPQHRERVFTVSILGGGDFQFPEPIPLEKKLKDVLEKEVDEKYYLSDDKVKTLKFSDATKTSRLGGRGSLDRRSWDIVKVGDLDIKGQDQIKRVYGINGISPTLSTMQGGNRQPKIIQLPMTTSDKDIVSTIRASLYKKGTRNTIENIESGLGFEGIVEPLKIKTANATGYDLAKDGDGVDLAYPDSKTRRGRVGHGVSKTIPTSSSQGVLDGIRIRKLTPKECYHLMGFDDESFDKANKVISSTQLYKTAGNSIVVDVLMAIFRELFKDGS